MNHLNLSIRALPMQRLLPVRSLDEFEHLVKESEVLTGAPGRTFVVAGADRPAYQVHADVAGFQIARLDGAMPHEVLATARELAGHPIGSAMACGLLYTEPLPQQRNSNDRPWQVGPFKENTIMSMNLPSIGSAQTPYGLASIHVGRYPVGGALFVELYTADDEMPGPLAMLSCNLAPSGVTLADDEFCVKSWSENEPLIEPLLATGLFEDTGRRTPTGYAVSPTWRIKDPQFVPPRRGR